MQVTEQPSPPSSKVGWRRVLADLSVTYVWAYDTVAILDDYDDSETGILPAGQLFRFTAVADTPHGFLCDLDDCRFIERTQLTPGRRVNPGCFATRLQVVIAATDYKTLTADADRPSWWRRLLRRIT